ncbi:hypothetical protein I6F35_35320 [Bradyrhizobium sp. BRP22]|uniref:hypothetical protein n=1 Tax=Bradyrhizobium sp. BRP22 TaxID=2793821 RepID=UPI001CD24D81|nr:hypothetical protein [Bradyrhizobium sp. BRP22]MCA1458393.1 hypothetical protein [Bradyrhizobium sp. BRP22]
MAESKRVKAFRLAIAKDIPKFPNDKASLQALQSKSLGALLIDHRKWRIRYIAPRARAVVIEPTATADPRWQSLAHEVQSLLEKVRSGADLTPYLSLQPHTRGFTPAATERGSDVDRWADKDLMLNVMGYHHLHFDAAPGNAVRSDNVMFAYVTRDKFMVVGIFNHAVFEQTESNPTITAERDHLWQIFDQRSARGLAPASVIVPTVITLSGHKIEFVRAATVYARLVAGIDPSLDDPNYVRCLYEQAGVPISKRPKVEWYLHFLDLGLLDKNVGAFICLKEGPN